MGKEKKFRAEEASRKSGVEEARTRKLSKRWLLSGNLLNWNIPLPFPFHRGVHYYTSQEIGGIVIGVARRVNPIRDSGLKTL